MPAIAASLAVAEGIGTKSDSRHFLLVFDSDFICLGGTDIELQSVEICRTIIPRKKEQKERRGIFIEPLWRLHTPSTHPKVSFSERVQEEN